MGYDVPFGAERTFGEPVDFFEVALQAARPGPSAPEGPIVNELRCAMPRAAAGSGGDDRRTGGEVRADVPTAARSHDDADVAGRGGSLLREHRSLAANDTAVAVELDPPQMIDTILRLLPDTTTVFVVIGTSPLLSTSGATS